MPTRFTAADVRRLAKRPVAGRRVSRPSPGSRYLDHVYRFCDLHALPRPQVEYRFHPTRKWRADFAWVAEKVALEVDGGTWSGGRHTRGSGWQKDAEKRRAYAALGYLVIPVTPLDAVKGIWVDTVREALRWARITPK